MITYFKALNDYVHVGSPVYFVIQGDYNYSTEQGTNKVSLFVLSYVYVYFDFSVDLYTNWL